MTMLDTESRVTFEAAMTASLNIPTSRLGEGFAKHTPTDPLEAILKVGSYIRANPTLPVPVVEGEVSLTAEEDADFSKRVLANLINATLSDKGAPSDDSLPAFTCSHYRADDTCHLAEARYFDTTEQLKGKHRLGKMLKANIFVEQGRPILLRKLLGETTCLSLCDISINGVVYPAGSILGSTFSRKFVDKPEVGFDRKAFTVHETRDIRSLTFLRLSLFALPLDQRPTWEFHHSVSTEKVQTIMNTHITDLAAKVQDVVKT